ncbi:MAG: hypothetical protein QNL04_05435 [SAR324 cluster bacterium]|nr:hypothetical protein [SAR324 cluster bacterium]
MKKFITALVTVMLLAPSAFAEVSIKASLTKGNYQIQTGGKWKLKAAKKATFTHGDFILLEPKAAVQLDLGQGATLILGGSSVVLVSQWKANSSGSINLIYGQAKLTTATSEVNINSPLGEFNLEEESIGYISVTGETLGLIIEKGEGELTTTSGDDQSIEMGEIAFYAGEIKSKQTTAQEILGKNLNLDSPDWLESPTTLWSLEELTKLELVDLETISELKLTRANATLNLEENSNFTPVKIEKVDAVAGKKVDDAPRLPLANIDDLKSRRIGDVMEIQITFEK